MTNEKLTDQKKQNTFQLIIKNRITVENITLWPFTQFNESQQTRSVKKLRIQLVMVYSKNAKKTFQFIYASFTRLIPRIRPQRPI